MGDLLVEVGDWLAAFPVYEEKKGVNVMQSIK